MRIETQEDVARLIRLHRKTTTYPYDRVPWFIENLCIAHNWATTPGIARDDRSHTACRRFARHCRRILDRTECPFHETESGRLVAGIGRCDNDYTHNTHS